MKQDSTNEITYLLATIGSLTERGGRVTTATDTPEFRAPAVVGSVLDNGDVIRDSPGRQDRVVAFVPVRSSISVH
jgi:hypothetical protein